MTGRSRRRLGLLTFALVAGAGPVAAPAHAADQAAAGWWSRDSVPPLAAEVPEGGLLVASAADGATAVSAVRYQLAAGESAPVLTLAASAQRGGPMLSVVACRGVTAWTPASDGDWAERPHADCSARAPGVPSEDGGSWTFDVAELVGRRGVLNVVLLPGTVAVEGMATPVPPTFEIAFEPAGHAALATTRGEASGPPDTASAPAYAADTEDVGALPTPPALWAAPPRPPAPAATASASSPSVAAATGPVAGAPTLPVAASDAASGARSAVPLLAFIVATAALLAGRRQAAFPTPRTAATPRAEVGGLGRYRGPRTRMPAGL